MTFGRIAGLVVIGSVAVLSGCGWHHVSSAGPVASATMPATRPELSAGTIRQVQTALKQDGLYRGTVDGLWGPETAGGVLTYQQRNNLRPSGELDGATLAALHVTPGASPAAAPGQASQPAVGNAPVETQPMPPPSGSATPPPGTGQAQ